jgi:cytochrome P450
MARQRGRLNLEQVMTLPLLDATVREVLRLHPIFPGTYRELWRPMRLCGHDLPAGTRVVACIYLVQRRADLFAEPSRFLPERFLNRTPTPCEWIPFGGGLRRCPGGAAALGHLKVVISTILCRAVLRPLSGPPRRAVRAFISLAPSGGVPAVLVSRAPIGSVGNHRPAHPAL